MASNYTANYGLCQWEPEDSFMRTEFNGDNARVDAAVRRTEDKADRALTSAIYAGYNVYNLALQHYYDGKETGWKQAMVFDGFVDGSMISSLSGGLARAQNKLTLTQSGQRDIELGYGAQGDVVTYDASTRTCAATGNGTLTGFTVKTERNGGGSATGGVTYSLSVNGVTVRSGTGELTFAAAAERVITFSQSVAIAAGDQLVMTLRCDASDNRIYLDGNGKLGGIFLITPLSGSSGTLVTSFFDLPPRSAMRAWVRYKNADLSLEATCMNTKYQMTGGTQYQTVNLQGERCIEREFVLDPAPERGLTQFTLSVTRGAFSPTEVYDYGVVLL